MGYGETVITLLGVDELPAEEEHLIRRVALAAHDSATYQELASSHHHLQAMEMQTKKTTKAHFSLEGERAQREDGVRQDRRVEECSAGEEISSRRLSRSWRCSRPD